MKISRSFPFVVIATGHWPVRFLNIAVSIPKSRKLDALIALQAVSDSYIVEDIITSDPLIQRSTRLDSTHTAALLDKRGWLHDTWKKIRNVIQLFKFAVKILLSVLERWLDKLAHLWTIAPNPNNASSTIL